MPSPRSTLAIAATAVLLLLTVSAWTGPVAELGESPVRIGQPRDADRVSYDVTVAADGFEPVDGTFAFAWDGTDRRVGPAGDRYLVHVVEAGIRLEGGWSWQGSRDRIEAAYQPGDVDPLTVDGNLDWLWTHSDGLHRQSYWANGTYRSFEGAPPFRYSPMVDGSVLCLMRSGWQGTDPDTIGGSPLSTVCPPAAPGDGTRLEAAGTGSVNGTETRLYRADLGDARGQMTVHLADGVPYPLRMELDLPAVRKPSIHVDRPAVEVELTLTGLDRDGVPVDGEADPVPERRDGFSMAEPTRWGIVEGDASKLPYPPSEAIEAIMSDPGLDDFREYLRDHPDARVDSYMFYRGPYENRIGRAAVQIEGWRFRFNAPGGDGYRVQVYRPVGAQAGPLATETPTTAPKAEGEALDLPPPEPGDRLDRHVALSDAVETIRDDDREVNILLRPSTRIFYGNSKLDLYDPHRDLVVADVTWGNVTLDDLAEGRISQSREFSFGVVDLQTGLTVTRGELGVDQELNPAGHPTAGGDPYGAPQPNVPAPGTPDWAVPVAAGAGVVVLIAAGLKLLLERGLVTLPLLSRITRDEILDTPTRAAVLEAIEDDPGVHVNELLRRLDVGDGTLRYHLDVLVDEGFVTRLDRGGYTRFFPAGLCSFEEMQRRAVLREGSREEIYRAIEDEPGLSQQEVAERCGIDPGAVSRAIRTLVEHGLVEKMRRGRSVALFPAGDG